MSNLPYPITELAANSYATGQVKQFLCIHGQTHRCINVHHVDEHASIINLIQSFPANGDEGFQIGTITLKEAIHELRNIRSDR